jgi:glycosyltransferase involved in cell wall biosynthesis
VPEVAVVIPAYNPGPHLSRSLGSVLAQEFSDWECIVLDDGSEPAVDLTGLTDDPRVRLHRQRNRGVSVARNVGVGLTDSRWVAFLDQDDEWHPSKLSRQVEQLRRPDAAPFSHTGFVWRLPHADLEGSRAEVTYRGLLAGRVHLLMSSLVVNRTAYVAVGGSDPMLAQQQDWALALELAKAYGSPCHVPDPLVTYSVHGGNASANYALAADEARCVLEPHRVAARHAGDPETVAAVAAGLARTRRLHGEQAIENARSAKETGDWSSAARHVAAATRLSPAVIATTAARMGRARLGRLGRLSGLGGPGRTGPADQPPRRARS